MAEAERPVGYKNPPHQTRFRKGESGNPGGRPRKLPSLRAELEAELAKPTEVVENGKRVLVSKQRGAVMKSIGEALGGDMRAMSAIIALTRSNEREAEQPSEAADREALDAFVRRELLRRGGDHD